MSAALHDVGSVALPVAIVLLAGTGVARAVLFTRLGDERARATARRYLRPLSVWCIGAAFVYIVARIAVGALALGSFALAVALGGVAVLLWLADHEPVPSEPAPVGDPEPPQWAEPPREVAEPPRLWSRG